MEQNKNKPEVRLASDGKAILLEVDGKVVPLSPENADALIQSVARERAKIQPVVPTDAPKTFNLENDPLYWVYPDEQAGGDYLLLRHSGSAWTSFRLPPAQAEKLAALLNEWATKRPSPPASGPERLFKYLSRHRLETTLREETFRIGTLYDFRRLEFDPKSVIPTRDGRAWFRRPASQLRLICEGTIRAHSTPGVSSG